MNVLVVESPAKAKSINKYLGNKFTVLASIGHIRDLSTNNNAINTDDNFKMNWELSDRGKKVINDITDAAKNSENLYLATDPDREGEAIGWHIAEFLKLPKNQQNRIVFNEFTKKAVFESISNPRKLDSNLYDSQQARRLLDRIYGFQVSPVLWKKVKYNTSAGRVQSPVLQFVIEREEEIENFIPEDFWNISAMLKIDNSEFKANLSDPNTKTNIKYRIFDNKKTDGIVNILKNNDAVVTDIKNTKSYKSPRPPFITSSLQQESSQKLSLSPDVTMSLAQQLFEGVDLNDGSSIGLITYMRTDSFTITPSAMTSVRNYISNEYGDKYIPEKPNHYKNKQRSQEAHECIRPADVKMTPKKLKNLISTDNRNLLRLYELIWKRFVSSQMEKAVYDVTKAVISCDKKYENEQLDFKIENWIIDFDGYYIIYGEDREASDSEITLNFQFKKGDKVIIEDVNSKADQTKPLPRYNEAMLVRKMEQEGIGRPSTYANTIKTNLKLYLEKKESRLHPTKLGRAISKFLKNHFSTEVSPVYTTDMEEKLDKIATGDMDWQLLLNDLYIKLELSIKNALEQDRVPKDEIEEYSDEHCPECESPMIIRSTKKNGTKFLGCSAFPKCKTTKPIITETNHLCPECKNGTIRELQGAKGSVYYGCADYPNCKFNSRYKPAEGKCLNDECKTETLFIRGNSLRCEMCKSFQKIPESMKISK